MDRRSFLKSTIAAAPLIISAKALGRSGPGANEVVDVAIVGLGGRSRDIVATMLEMPQVRIVAVCDCFGPRVDSARKALADRGITCNGYLDLEEMLEKEKCEGVMVETTTHARAWVTCLAMAAGKDVYIEKPMCLSVAEGREMVNCARHFKSVTQVGTQQRSIALNNWASDLVKNGAIGKIKRVLAPNFIGGLTWEDKEAQEMPDGGRADWWDVWTNQCQLRPYHEHLHYWWNNWLEYDGGGMSFGVTGWGTHSYDQLQRGLGTDETGPVEIILEEPVSVRRGYSDEDRQPDPSETGEPYYDMVKDKRGPRAKVTMKYESGTEVLLHLDANYGPGLGCIFEGENGTIEINRDKIKLDPEELLSSPDNPGHLQVAETQPHIADWVDCIKSRNKCTADIEYGQRSSTMCYLVNIARAVGRVGESLHWDPKAERFTNCDEGDAMLQLERREGYELPKLT
ncbi:MAG: Gfo/Idh/MocA family oxidoreductase [Candidatus Hydrogenedentales bacterium]|jgi:predicted dehydrogenase